MPFISKDWRSPGEEWVKTQEGWEKKKVLECTSQRYQTINYNNSDKDQKWSEENENSVRVPPHCHITIKCTREIAGFNGLSEAVRRLDFTSAVRDVRRFHYACALLELLLRGQKLNSLPGAAQKLLLSMLEQLADHVATSQQNLNSLRQLCASLLSSLESERGACWGRPLGSRALWTHHNSAIDRITTIARTIHIHEPGPEVVPKLHDLPEECIREVLLRISDHRDLDAASSAWPVMSAITSEQRVWRELVRFHFTHTQIQTVDGDKDGDWRKLFHRLRKQHGLRAEASLRDSLWLCRHCCCLYWTQLGHPCIADQCPEYREKLKECGGPLPPRPVPPADFLQFFSL